MDKKGNAMRLVILSVVMILIGSFVTKYIDSRSQRKLPVSGKDWSKLELILDQIVDNYVEEIDQREFTEKIIPHIMSELDPHSIYLPPKNLEEATTELEGNIEGIGITFNVPEDTAVVINVVVGGPAEREGIISGDRIMKINGINVAGVKMPQDSMVGMMRGIAGTKVKVSVLRDEDTVDFNIKRDKIPVKSVDVAYMMDNETGYIKLSKFTRNSYNEFSKALDNLLAKGMKRLIFDLQDNTGGYLDQALLLSNQFLKAGDLIVYMEGAHRARQEFTADGNGKCLDTELYVLVNEGSASSSEVFAGAMQDNDRATIFGRRSFGKGCVQEPILFSDNSGIRLTIARFHSATGRCIQKPYNKGGDAYNYDIIERYAHGEMTDVDSIPKNDSLKYTTKGGKIVYGGGGIIPDVFVPMDTVGVTDMLIQCNRNASAIKYASNVAIKYRKELSRVESMEELNILLDSMNLEAGFKNYLRSQNIKVTDRDWNISGDILVTQLRALVGRYSPMDDKAFFPVINRLDKTIETARNYKVSE